MQLARSRSLAVDPSTLPYPLIGVDVRVDIPAHAAQGADVSRIEQQHERFLNIGLKIRQHRLDYYKWNYMIHRMLNVTQADLVLQTIETNMAQNLGTGVSIVSMGLVLFGISESFRRPGRWIVRFNGMLMACTGIIWVIVCTYEYSAILSHMSEGSNALRISSRVYPVLGITYSVLSFILMSLVCWRKVLQIPKLSYNLSNRSYSTHSGGLLPITIPPPP
jgi:hypothetical protein